MEALRRSATRCRAAAVPALSRGCAGAARAAPIPTARPEDVGMCTARLGRASSIMERLVRERRLPYARLVVARRGQLVLDARVDSELGSPGGDEAVYRLFSLSKIFASVAYGVLMEKYGAELDEPLARYLGPKWAQQQVYLGGDASDLRLEPARRPLTARDCLTHTGGLFYPGLVGLLGGATEAPSVPETMMLERGLGYPMDHAQCEVMARMGLHGYVDALAELPLKFQPGTSFEYSYGHLIIGRVIEVASGMSLKDFMRREVLEPLGCSEAAGWYPRHKSDLQPMYSYASVLQDPMSVDCASPLVDVATLEPVGQSFGTFHVNDALREAGVAFWSDAQLVATTMDCLRLAEMLAHRGRTADGGRLLAPSTAALLTGNCLPDGRALQWNSWGRGRLPSDAQSGPLVSDLVPEGAAGYGLGGLTWLPGAVRRTGSVACQEGAYYWYGVAGTMMQADPANELSIVFMTQCACAMNGNQPELGPVGSVMQAVYRSLTDA